MGVSNDNNNTIPSNDESFAGSGWLSREALYDEISKTFPNDNDAGLSLLTIAFANDGRGVTPDFFEEYYGMVEIVSDTVISVKLCKAASKALAQDCPSFSLVIIDKEFIDDRTKLSRLYGPFDAPPRSQTSVEETQTDSKVDLIASTDSTTMNKFTNLGLDSSFGVSASANRLSTEKRREEQISLQNNSASQAEGNALNSKGISTNRPSVLINSSFVPVSASPSPAFTRLEASVLYHLRKIDVLKKYFDEFYSTNFEIYEEYKQEYIEFQQTIEYSLEMIELVDQFKID